MDEEYPRLEARSWHYLAHQTGLITSTVEEYTRYLPGAISILPDHPRSYLMIEWRDEKEDNQLHVEFKAKEEKYLGNTKENESLKRARSLKDEFIYDPKTWLISEIKFYHELPKNSTQIAWPSDYNHIVPILDSFTPFQRLPIELRYIIWNHALSSNPRAVKLKVDRKYQHKKVIRLSCHVRQHGPPATKLPVPLLYVCQESKFLFLKRYKKMDLIIPVKRCDLNLRLVGHPRDKVANCEIRVGRKGYIDFCHDTLIIHDFSKITSILWRWNHTSLDLSLIESIALSPSSWPADPSPNPEREIAMWKALETCCPILKHLTFVVRIFKMENNCWETEPQAVARLLPINAELLDDTAHSCFITCQDMYLHAKSPHDLQELKAELRESIQTMLAWLGRRYADANATRALYYRQVERNPDYWRKINFEVAFISWVVSSFYIERKMEKVMVTPPKNLQSLMPDSYFWAQRPIELAHDQPFLWFGYLNRCIACQPDGSLLNRYEGVKEMFECQED
ncbi:hypothetical protein OCU04_005764 [Sclerotinia nivalis]|uniref:2EXR domain-containing protein n=1 Tax=Sclerotinia nivalis TaxID=352851 RepID=A0A9X0ALN9_9HELO|nr:hypothetical protein OCU04_005764 [Sclerotinia nivalis]